MELKDTKAMKHAKLVATAGIATVAIAAGTAQALACAPKQSQPPRQINHVRQTENPPPPTVQTAVITTIAETPVQPVSMPQPVTTTTVTVAATTPQPVKSVSTQQPATTLPATGPGEVVVPAAGVGVIGYAGNLIRIKRKQLRR